MCRIISSVSYTHLDVYKRQQLSNVAAQLSNVATQLLNVADQLSNVAA